jgi:hypothetical protein
LAFLDSDDLFQPDRFKVTKQLFEENLSIDGVYGSIRTIVTDEQFQEFADIRFKSEITGVRQPISPDRLFHELARNRYATFH